LPVRPTDDLIESVAKPCDARFLDAQVRLPRTLPYEGWRRVWRRMIRRRWRRIPRVEFKDSGDGRAQAIRISEHPVVESRKLVSSSPGVRHHIGYAPDGGEIDPIA